jgi:uncharacterized membrane protein
MFELLTGAGLAAAAGLNAYIPLLVLGLSSRFLDWVDLPAGWAWLENDWVLVILGVLLVVEVVADKIPVVDSINDWLQTIVRPTAGGIVFGSGATSETVAVTDPASFFASNQWVPIAIGVLLALTVHTGKLLARPAANAATFGLAAPVLSTVEDAVSVVLAILAILAPVLVLLGLAGLGIAIAAAFRRFRRRRSDGRTPPDVPKPI